MSGPEKIAALYALAAQGLTRTEAGKRVGLSRIEVTKLAIKHGIQFPDARRQPRPRPSSYGERLAALAAEGLTNRQAAERLGLAPQDVRTAAYRLGITFAPAQRGKSTAQVAAEIRAIWARWVSERPAGVKQQKGRSKAVLAALFGVSRETVSKIVAGKIWKAVA